MGERSDGVVWELSYKDEPSHGLVRDKQMTDTSIRVEPIDNHHPAWGQVLAEIFRTGNRAGIMLREDGWLSSRQTVLAAFDGGAMVGHLCFRVEPVRSGPGRTAVASRVDSFSVDGQYSDQRVHDSLLSRAKSLAKLMKCSPPRIELAAC
jgi:hypothetical protein